MRSGAGIYNFTHHEGPQWQLEAGMACPELAIGYEESYVLDLCTRHGLDVIGQYDGSWSGRLGAPETERLGQDLVVGVKV